MRSSRSLLLLLAALISLFLPACGLLGEPTPDLGSPNTVTAFGVGFRYPGNWKLEQSEEVTSDIKVATLTTESRGSGLAMVQIFKPGVPLDAADVLRSFLKELPGAVDETAVGSVASVTTQGSEDVTRTIAGTTRAGKRSTFRIRVLSETVPHTLEVYAFALGDVSVAIYFQAADEDLAKAGLAFDHIASTLATEAQ